MTAYQAEKSVERAVRALGMPTWLGQHEDEKHRVGLLFPRYLLFQADLGGDDRWRDLYSQPGVDQVLGTRGERPTPLRAGSLDGLFGECALDGVIYQGQPTQRAGSAAKPHLRSARAPQPPVAAGAAVELTAGVFKGWRAACKWSSKARVQVLLAMMGKDVPLELPLEHVRAVLVGAK